MTHRSLRGTLPSGMRARSPAAERIAQHLIIDRRVPANIPQAPAHLREGAQELGTVGAVELDSGACNLGVALPHSTNPLVLGLSHKARHSALPGKPINCLWAQACQASAAIAQAMASTQGLGTHACGGGPDGQDRLVHQSGGHLE